MAAYIIRYFVSPLLFVIEYLLYLSFLQPEYKIADPICTFLFSIIVVTTTVPILRDLSIILMEGLPPGIEYTEIISHLKEINGVKMVHSLHVWAITLDKNALSVHLAICGEFYD